MARNTPAGAPSVAFTIVTNDGGPLTKSYSIDAAGDVKKFREPGLSAGTARRMKLTGKPGDMLKAFADHLTGLKPNQAVILAPPRGDRDEWPLASRKVAAGRDGVLTRTRDNFPVPDGPELFGLDIDGKGYPAWVIDRLKEAGGLSAALVDVWSPLADAASVVRYSVSTGIRNARTGDETPMLGQHRYLIVRDAADVADFAQRLADRLILAGWLWGEVTKSGMIVLRTLTDTAASVDLSRLWYESDAILESAELQHVADARKPMVRPGGALDTRALPALTADEAAQLKRMQDDVTKALSGEADKARQAWKRERADALVAKGHTRETADRILGFAVARHVLSGGFEIHLDDGSVATVADILADPDAYHRKTCADPLEPEYGGGRNKAIIYSDKHPRRISSRAHGGIEYTLEPDASTYFEPLPAAADGVASTNASQPPISAADNVAWDEPLDVYGDSDDSMLADIPADALPPVIERFARDVAERMGASTAFVAGGALVTLSAAIGGGVRIQPKRHDDGWREAAFLWLVNVAPPGSKKSPAMAEAVAPLRALDKRQMDEDMKRRRAWEEANKGKSRKGASGAPRPHLRRLVLENTTIEALAAALEGNPKGALLFADEWAGMIGGVGQYKANGGSDRAEMLKLHNGAPNMFDRVNTGGARSIECWGASIVGATQPDKLREMIKKNGMTADGLFQRFAFIYDDGRRREGVDRQRDSEACQAYADLITGVASLSAAAAKGTVRLSDDAQTARIELDRLLDELQHAPGLSDAWAGHLSKWSGIFARLMLVFHVASHWEEHLADIVDIPVSGATAKRAARFARYLLRHGLRVYGEFIGLGEAAEAARKAAGAILMCKGESEIGRPAVYRHVRAWEPIDRRINPEMLAGLRVLERYGWCRAVDFGADGNPSTWRVNPHVYERFSDRATLEMQRRAFEHERVKASAQARRKLLEGAS